MRTGMRLRLVGQGEPGEPGAARGDLFVVIVIEENTLFKLKRNNVLCEVPISFTQAALGGMIEVPTLRGKAKLKIPAGTQTGAILRMRGQGFPSLDGKHTGDQLVTVTVEIPACLTPAQQDTIQNLHEAGSLESYPQRRAFTERLRKWCEH